MNFDKTPVADAVEAIVAPIAKKATRAAKNVSREAKQPSDATQSPEMYTRDVVEAVGELREFETEHGAQYANLGELQKAARQSVRYAIRGAHKGVKAGRAWSQWLADTRVALVKAAYFSDVKAAGKFLDNQLVALKLTGRGVNKGGRPAKEETGGAVEGDAGAKLAAMAMFVAKMQRKYSDDADVLADWGDAAAILGKVQRKAKRK